MSLPPHFIDKKNKEVVFHIKGGHPVKMAIPTWMKSFPDHYNKKQENLLKNSAKSLTDSWLLGALYIRWKKLKSIREQSSPDCSSSFQEWTKKIEDTDVCQS